MPEFKLAFADSRKARDEGITRLVGVFEVSRVYSLERQEGPARIKHNRFEVETGESGGSFILGR
jgi:hypothetical protein